MGTVAEAALASAAGEFGLSSSCARGSSESQTSFAGRLHAILASRGPFC